MGDSLQAGLLQGRQVELSATYTCEGAGSRSESQSERTTVWQGRDEAHSRADHQLELPAGKVLYKSVQKTVWLTHGRQEQSLFVLLPE